MNGNVVKVIENDILDKDKIHPSAKSAYEFLETISVKDVSTLMKIFEKNAEKNSEIARVNLFTFKRFINNEEVTDLHILGLSWTINAIVTELQIEETTKKLAEAMKMSTQKVDEKQKDMIKDCN